MLLTELSIRLDSAYASSSALLADCTSVTCKKSSGLSAMLANWNILMLIHLPAL